LQRKSSHERRLPSGSSIAIGSSEKRGAAAEQSGMCPNKKDKFFKKNFLERILK
jgi:hypothetical protein